MTSTRPLQFLMLLLAMCLGTTVNAQQFQYKTYRHEPFNDRLAFDIHDSWDPVQNELEIIFMDAEGNLPQLFFQTVGKTDEFEDAPTFFQFLKSEGWDDVEFGLDQPVYSGRYHAVQFESTEPGFPHLYTYGLIVDVGEGMLFFYLKVPRDDAPQYRQILERVRTTIEFQ